MLFAHESLRRPLLVAMLAAGGVGSAFAAPADQNFDAVPLDPLGNPATIAGVTYFNNDAAKNISIVTDGFIANTLGDRALGFRSTNASTSTEVGFKTADGSEFKLNSFVLDRGFGSDDSVTVKGYRDNTEVASQVVDVTNFTATVNVAANTAWENIDEVRITGTDLDIDIDDLDFSPAVVANTAPVIGNLDGIVAWPGIGNTVTLDIGADAAATDMQLGALNGGLGNWDGAVLTVRRKTNAVPADTFGLNLSAPFGAGGGQITHGGVTIANYSISGGLLTVTFTDVAKPVLTSYVTEILRSVEYSNDQPAGDAVIEFSLSDGTLSGKAEVTVESDMIYVTNTTDTATINPVNGTSFSEAVAIAAADATGSQTLVFTNAFSAAINLAGNLAINESLTLDASAANSLLISSGTTITLGSGTTLRLTSSGSVTINSTLAGSGSLRKEGAGTLVLGSVSNEANMSGGITIAGGALQILSDDHLSSGTLTLDGGTLTNNASSMTIDNLISLGSAGGTFNIGGGSGATMVTLSGVVSGSGTLTKNGQAILELSGSNSYTGATSVSSGTVIASHANALGTTAGGTTVSSGATVRVAGALTLAESFNIAGTGKTVSAVDYGALHLVSGSSTISGSIALDGDANVSAASGASLTLAGSVSGASTLTKTDAGTLFLNNTGNSVSHTGGTTVDAGTLSINAAANLGSGTLTFNGGNFSINSAMTINNPIVMSGNGNVVPNFTTTFAGAISGGGTLTKAGPGNLTLSGTNIGTGGITLASGTLSIASDSNLPSGNLTIVGGTLAVTGITTIDNGIVVAVNANVQSTAATKFSGSISGPGGLTKTGAASLTLTGANSYLGSTTVSAGTLVNNASSSFSSFIVQSGVTLSGGGVGGGVTVLAGGTLAPGPGDLAVNGNLSMASGSTLAVEINGATAGTGYDQILVTGTVDVSAATLAVSHGYTPAGGDAYAIIVNDASDAITGTFSGLAEGGSITAAGNGTALAASYIGGTGNDFVLTLANTAPTVANAIPNQNATEDSVFSFQFASNTFADADSNPLTYTAQLAGGGSLPSWLSFDGATRTFSGTPLNADVGTVSIDVIANDGNGGTVTDTFNIVIANTNDDPIVANVIPNQNATEDSAFSFQFASNTFSDPDVGDSLTYSAQLAGGGSLPSWLSFNQATRTFFGTPLNADVGTISIDVIADDNNGGTVTDTFNITVANTNDAPTVANAIPNQNAMLGSAFNFQFAGNTFNDQDVDDTLAYSVQLNGGGALPLWLSFDGATRTFSGTPGASDLGLLSIDVIANDGNGGTVTATFGLRVKNSVPVVTNVGTLAADGTYKVGGTVVVVVTFDQPVTLNTMSGTPTLTLETGAVDRVVSYTSGSGTNTLAFSYAVQAGDTSADLDYVSTTALGMNGASIRNSEDTVANILLPAPGAAGSLGANADIVIDTTGPVADIVVSDSDIIIGDTPSVTITFNEAVTGFAVTDLAAAGGTLNNLTTTDNITWTATFAPGTDTETSGTVTLAAGTVTDAVGNTNSSASSFIYTVDTRRPTATLEVADTSLKADETTTLTITFSEPVTGFTVEDLGAQNASLNNLVNTGGNVWTATLTPNPGADDSTNVVWFDQASVADVKGNAGTGMKPSNNYTIDTVRPTAAITMPVNALKAGQIGNVKITFSEAVTGFTLEDVSVENGSLGNLSTTDNIVFFARLTPDADVEDSTNVMTLDLTGVTDGQGNEGQGTVESDNYSVDTLAPRITSVTFPPGLYTEGQQFDVTVTFSEPVTAINPDQPTTAIYGITLTPDLGEDFAAAASVLTPGNLSIVLRATIPANVTDTDGITPGLTLLGSPEFGDMAGNPLDTTLRNVTGASGVLVDSMAPDLVQPIPQQTMVIGEAPVTIDLTDHFHDVGSSSLTFTVDANSDDAKASASINGNLLTVTALSNGITEITVRADDGRGNSSTGTFLVSVGTAEPTAVQPVLSGTLNRQTGLFELTVNVTNTTPQPINGMRLHVDFSAYLAQHPSLRLYNATATTAPGIAYVDHAFPVAVDGTVSVKLSFYTSTRLFPEPFAPTLTVETLASSALPDTNGDGVPAAFVNLQDGNKLIEFPTEAGKWYRVRYSHDMVNWYDSPVPLQAGANRMQWIDSGPPFTQSPPSSVPSRFYIVNEITAP